MSRKHYIKLADMVRGLPLTDNEKRLVANGIADVAKEDNPAFQRQTFLTACGLKP